MRVIAQKKSAESKTEALVLLLAKSPENTSQNEKKTKAERNPSSLKASQYAGLPEPAFARLQEAVEKKQFQGGTKDLMVFRSGLEDGRHLIFVGLGPQDKLEAESFRSAGGQVLGQLKALKASSASLFTANWPKVKSTKDSAELVQALAEGLWLANYSFDELKNQSSPKKKQAEPSYKGPDYIELMGPGTSGWNKALAEAEVLADCTNFARRLGDLPGNLMTPEILGEETVKKAKGTGLKVTLWNRARIQKERMGGLLGVSKGSGNEPRFIILEYKGAAASKKPICFVGKGLTFDTGGVSIKPAAGMEEMKYDMCGGANVIASLLAIARLKLKVNAIGLVPATENAIGPIANKPGDILIARNGKSIEVNNTDAEGRVILADALSYASEQKPQAIVDAATLTGAMVIALGNIHTGVYSRSAELMKKIHEAAQRSGELIWPMPLTDQHVEDIKGSFGDFSNIGASRGAGSATAAAFLEQFVESSIPWAHFDIAGTGWNTGNRLSYCPKKGASGVMIRTFVELARRF